MYKKIKITDKRVLIVKLVVCLVISTIIVLAFNSIRITHDSYNQHITNAIFQKFEDMSGSYDKPIKSVTINGITINIYGIVFENREILLKYNLMKDGNNLITEQAVSYAMVSCQNQSYNYNSEFNMKAPGSSSPSASLAVLANSKADAGADLLNKTVKISVNIMYKVTHDSQALTQDFAFDYTPDKIYAEKIIPVNHEFYYKDKLINIKQVILNGLYMRIECDYKREESSDIWCLFKAYDEFGKEAEALGATASETTSEYFFSNISEKASKLYLYPRLSQYDVTGKEKIILIDEKIEISLIQN